MTPRRTALADQAEASRRDARLHAFNTATLMPGAVITQPEKLPTWARTKIRTLRALHRNGHSKPCPHVNGSPQPLIGAAWAPGLLACTTCAPALLVAAVDVNDTSCDRCHKTTLLGAAKYIDRGDDLLYLATLCAPCMTTLQASTSPPQQANRQKPRPRRKPRRR